MVKVKMDENVSKDHKIDKRKKDTKVGDGKKKGMDTRGKQQCLMGR